LEIIKTGKIPRSYYDLEIQGNDEIYDSSDSEVSEAESSDDDEYDPNPVKTCEQLPYSLTQMKDILALYDDPRFKGNRLNRVTNRFRRIKNATQIHRIREQVKTCGSRIYKLRQLDTELFEQFLKWKSQKQVIRDRFLLESAFFIAHRLHLDNFTGSYSFLMHFKKRHRIVGRKITEVVTVKSHHEEADILKSATEFVERAKVTIDNRPARKVMVSPLVLQTLYYFHRFLILIKWVFNLKRHQDEHLHFKEKRRLPPSFKVRMPPLIL
jgi:hypothetical protein